MAHVAETSRVRIYVILLVDGGQRGSREAQVDGDCDGDWDTLATFIISSSLAGWEMTELAQRYYLQDSGA